MLINRPSPSGGKTGYGTRFVCLFRNPRFISVRRIPHARESRGGGGRGPVIGLRLVTRGLRKDCIRTHFCCGLDHVLSHGQWLVNKLGNYSIGQTLTNQT